MSATSRWYAAPSSLRPPAAREVHVFCASLDAAGEEEAVGVLSADERARASRFHFERDRRHFRVARGLLRRLLGLYLDLDPGAIRFAYGPAGKPTLLSPGGLHFNLSHSGGVAVLAFARDRALGVDVERERPVPELDSIALRYFSAQEGADLRVLAEPERTRAFFRCWTRKEAFIKATGEGLTRALDAFDVTLAPGERARLRRVEGDPEAPERWWLEDLEPPAGFAAALALEGRPDRVARWTIKPWGEKSHEPRRAGRQDDLQGGAEPRGAVLDLAG